MAMYCAFCTSFHRDWDVLSPFRNHGSTLVKSSAESASHWDKIIPYAHHLDLLGLFDLSRHKTKPPLIGNSIRLYIFAYSLFCKLLLLYSPIALLWATYLLQPEHLQTSISNERLRCQMRKVILDQEDQSPGSQYEDPFFHNV
jgi:hypothetical protein